MKLKSIALIVFLSTMFFPMLAQASLTDGLMAYYPFNGNSQDESGNGNDGAVFGAVSAPDRFGILNSAYVFDGIDDYIKISSFSTLNVNASQTPITYSFWVKREADTAGVVMGGGPDHQKNFLLIVPGNIFIWHQWPHNKLPYISSKPSLPLQNWVHVVVEQNYNQWVKIYINNVLDTQVANPYYYTGNSPQFYLIGAHQSAGKIMGFFRGAIDDIRVYNRLLTETEISELFRETVELPPAADCSCKENASAAAIADDLDASGYPEIAYLGLNAEGAPTICFKDIQNGNCVFSNVITSAGHLTNSLEALPRRESEANAAFSAAVTEISSGRMKVILEEIPEEGEPFEVMVP